MSGLPIGSAGPGRARPCAPHRPDVGICGRGTDNTEGTLRHDGGDFDRNNRLTLNGSYTDAQGESSDTRTVLEIVSPRKQKLTMYRDGGLLDEETKVLEIVYTKSTNPTEAWTYAD